MNNVNLRRWLRSLRNATTYLGLGMVVLIWIGLLWSQQVGRENFIQAAQENGNNLARAYEESVIRAVSEIDKTLLLLRSRYLLDPEHFNIRAAANDPLIISDLVKNIAVIGADGFMVSSDRSSKDARLDLRDRDHYRVFRDDPTDRLDIGKPVIGRASGRWVTLFSRPIIAADGSFQGVISAAVDPEELARFFEIVDIGAEGRITLFGEDGIVRAARGGAREILGKKLDSPLWRVYPQASSGHFYAQNFDSVRRLVAFRKIRGLPLIGAVAFSEKELMASFLDAQRVDDVIAAGISLLILLGIAFNARHRAKLDAAHQAVRASEAKALVKSRELAVTLEHMSQGLMMVDNDRKVAVINQQAVRLLDLPEDFLRGDRPFDDVLRCLWEQGDFGVDGETLEPRVREFIKAGGLIDIGSYERIRPNGTVLEVQSVPLPGGGLVRTFTDITVRRHSEARIAHMASHDELTGLANRVLLHERIEQAIARARRTDEQFAVLLLDLDRFKDVNDTLGHQAGDVLLKIAAQRLCQAVREIDTVSRLGGDEFAVVQSALVGSKDAETLCRRIFDVIGQPYEISGQVVEIRTSIGIAMAPADGVDAEQLLKKADIALYAVKSAGRGGWRFFEPDMETSAQARRALEHDLRKALLKGDELQVLYQPMIDLVSGEVDGFEALLRWNHPHRGTVMPTEFIPVAEEVGLIADIGEWVLRTACAAAVEWPDTVKIAINLSPAQFKDHKLVDVVKHALSDSTLPARRLELEITETVMLQESEANLSALQELRALGTGIALDDFGTGYSSLSHLRAFPFTKIKIDRSFVKELGNKPDCAAIVRAVADLGRSLDVPTIAEGVETREQLDFVRAAGCRQAQGYLFSPPVPVWDVEAIIRRRKRVAKRVAERAA
jgi:diguanylate cyclase (GGDEF)-like protein